MHASKSVPSPGPCLGTEHNFQTVCNKAEPGIGATVVVLVVLATMDEKLRRRHGTEVDAGAIIGRGPLADGGAGELIAGPDVGRRNKRSTDFIEVIFLLCRV